MHMIIQQIKFGTIFTTARDPKSPKGQRSRSQGQCQNQFWPTSTLLLQLRLPNF